MGQTVFKHVIQEKQPITSLQIHFTHKWALCALAVVHVNNNVHNEFAGSEPKPLCCEGGVLWSHHSTSWEGSTLIAELIIKSLFCSFVDTVD